MKILWDNGYIGQHLTENAAVRDPRAQICNAHAARGDTDQRPVALIDNSGGEYTPVALCADCLVDLANEVLGIKE